MKNLVYKIINAIAMILLIGSMQYAEGEVALKVTVEGLDGEMLENLLEYLSINQHQDYPSLSERLIRNLHEKAAGEIHRALQPFGYYNPEINSELTHKDSVWNAKYEIKPGNPVLITGVDLLITGDGADDESLNKLTGDFPVKKGEVLEHKQYEKAKEALQKIAAERGYFDAEITAHSVKVYPELNTAEVELYFETGPRYRFGEIIFRQEILDKGFLSRLVPFKKGDYYDLHALLELRNILNNSGYFKHIEIETGQDIAEDSEVPVIVTLTPLNRNRYTFGIGYGTDTGARTSLGWENRRVNRSGHRMNAELKFSEIKSGLTAEYIVPLKNPRTESMIYTAGFSKEDKDTAESETFILGLRHNHKRGKWRETWYTNYQDEKFSISADSGRSSLLMPGISWSKIKAEDSLYIRSGSRIFADIKGAHESILSDASFIQLRLQTKYIYSPWKPGRIILRGEGGAGLVDDFSELPASLRFFAGGDQSVRGYELDSIGPVDAKGEVTGGKHLIFGSMEYEHIIINKWSGALFFDMGNALNDLSSSMKKGAGFGIRWRLPVGQVRLDLAYALDKDEGPWRIHFNIGADL